MSRAMPEDESPFARAMQVHTADPTTERGRPGPKPVGTPDWKPVFIGLLMEGADVRRAAKRAGVHFTTVYEARQYNEAFRRAWQEAAEIGTELLEQEAQRRAYHGVLKPVFQKGVKVGVVREYSDTLLMFLLKKRDPSYRDGTTVNVNNQDNSVTVNVFDDIQRAAECLRAGRVLPGPGAPGGNLLANGPEKQVDEAQSMHPQVEPAADRLPDGRGHD